MKKISICMITVCYLFILCFTAEADIRSDRYDSDADAIKKQLFTKKGKHELSPTFALSTNDAFYQIYYFGLVYNYHFADWVSLGLTLSGSATQATGLTKTLSNPPSPQAGESPGFGIKPDVRRPFFLSTIGLQARFAPVYGKLNFFSEAIVHFDIYFTLGGGLFLSHPPDVTGDPERTTNPDGMGFHPFGEVGVGQRYFMLQWLALRWEFSLMMMPETFAMRGNETRLRLNMQFHIGFSFFF
jgi:outer membrane beta-barrel protein